MPKRLDEAFEVTMNRIKDQSADRSKLAMAVIKWTPLSEKQLEIAELQRALAVELDDSAGDVLDWENIPPERTLPE